jgi:Domain of unknown function (DUF4149)
MRRIAEALYQIAIVAWVGCLWAIGYLAAPVLFASLGDRQLAGIVAGKLFSLVGWIGLGCAAYIGIYLIFRWRAQAFRHSVFWVTLAMGVMVAVGHFGLQPLLAQLKAEAWPRDVMESVLRDRFVAWHGVSSILYLIQSVLGLWLVLAGGRGLR